MARHRKPNIYDNEIYNHFGEQPYLFEIQLGYELIPLTLNGTETSLQKEITLCRNQVDAEYGLPLPSVHI